MIELIGETPLPTEYGSWTYMVFREKPSGRQHQMMVYKRPSNVHEYILNKDVVRR